MTQDAPVQSRGPLPNSQHVVPARLADLDGTVIRTQIDQEVDRILCCLRGKMKAARVSQVAVQRIMGWKGSNLSQLFNRTKALRVEQLLIVLEILEMPPHHFFHEIYSPAISLPQPLEVQQNLLQRMREGFSSLGEVLELLLLDEEPDKYVVHVRAGMPYAKDAFDAAHARAAWLKSTDGR